MNGNDDAQRIAQLREEVAAEVRQYIASGKYYPRMWDLDFLLALLAEQAATIERTSSVHYSPDMRRAPITYPASEGWDARDWHAAGVADTGTSHILVGRPYVVACEWCPEVFLAETAAGAMSMFRAHESQMLGQRTEGQG